MTTVLRVEVSRSTDEPEKPLDLYARYRDTLATGLATQGRISPQRVWRLGVMGDTRVFRSAPQETSRVTANVAILLDWSGSQHDYVKVLQQSLDAIGTATTRLGFKTWAGAYTYEVSTAVDTGRSLKAIHIAQVKGFGESTWDSRRVANLPEMGMGGTPTGPALTYVRTRVLPEVEGRTILLVITDGRSAHESWETSEVKKIAAIPNMIVAGMYCGQSESEWEGLQTKYPVAYKVSDRSHLPNAFEALIARLRGMR